MLDRFLSNFHTFGCLDKGIDELDLNFGFYSKVHPQKHCIMEIKEGNERPGRGDDCRARRSEIFKIATEAARRHFRVALRVEGEAEEAEE